MSWIKEGFWTNTSYRQLTYILLIAPPIWDILISLIDREVFYTSTVLGYSILAVAIGIAYLKRNRP